MKSLHGRPPGSATLCALSIGGGALCGLLIVRIMGLTSNIWTLAFLLGLAIFVVAIFTGSTKKFFLIAFVLALPADPDVKFFGGNLVISVTSLLIIYLILQWLGELLVDKSLTIHYSPIITAPALLLLGASIVSLLVNNERGYIPLLSLYQPFVEVLVLFYFANNIRTVKEVRIVVIALIVGAIGQGGVALIELWSSQDLALNFQKSVVPEVSKAEGLLLRQPIGDTAYARVSGTLSHPNTLSVYLAAFVALIALLSFNPMPRWFKGAGIAMSIVFTFVIINTFSRGGWLIYASVLVFLLATYLVKRGKIYKLSIGLGVAVLVGIAALLPMWEPVSGRLTTDVSTQIRLPLMEIAWNMIKDNFLFGVGYGNYLSWIWTYDETYMGATNMFPAPVHNVYLHVAAETGVVGFLALVWLTAGTVFVGWKYVRSDLRFPANVGLGMVLMALMLLAHGLVNPFSAREEWLLIFFSSGFAMAIHRIINQLDDKESQT